MDAPRYTSDPFHAGHSAETAHASSEARAAPSTAQSVQDRVASMTESGDKSPVRAASSKPSARARDVSQRALVLLLGEVLEVERYASKLMESLVTQPGSSRSTREAKREGVLALALVRDRMGGVLASQGVAPFGVDVGTPVDLHRCEVLARIESENGSPGTIAELIRPGHELPDGVVVERALVTVFVRMPRRSGGQVETTEEGDCQ